MVINDLRLKGQKVRNVYLPGLMLLITLLLPAHHLYANGRDIENAVASLNEQIENGCTASELSRLHLYRARQYAKLGRKSAARQDYQAALKYNYAGWIANEYGYFLYHCGEYAKAYKTAKKVLQDFPQLSGEANRLKKQAGDKFKEQYFEENPPAIVMDVQVDPDRKTRHDLIRQQRPQKAVVYKYPSVTTASSAKSSSSSATKPIRRST